MNPRFLTEPGELEARWEQIAPLLAPALEHAVLGEITLDDIKALALARCMYVGIYEVDGAPVLAMAFEFKHYPRIMTVNIVALGGTHLDQVAQRFFDGFKEWVARAGARHIEALCRPAIARLLKKYGFQNTYEKISLAV
jgi:hypothetical protein